MGEDELEVLEKCLREGNQLETEKMGKQQEELY